MKGRQRNNEDIYLCMTPFLANKGLTRLTIIIDHAYLMHGPFYKWLLYTSYNDGLKAADREPIDLCTATDEGSINQSIVPVIILCLLVGLHWGPMADTSRSFAI